MSHEDFKAQFLQALTEDVGFADKVATCVAEQCSISIDTSEGYNQPGHFKVSLHIGSVVVSDFACIDVQSSFRCGPYV